MKSLIVGVQISEIDGDQASVEIIFPKEQGTLPMRESAHILAEGISLIIKTCSKFDMEIKDYELMREIIDHLNEQFASISSFEDAELIEPKIKENE